MSMLLIPLTLHYVALMMEVRCQRWVPGRRNGLITQGSKKLQMTLGNRKWLIVAGIKRWWKVRLQGKVGLDRRFPITWCRVLACLV